MPRKPKDDLKPAKPSGGRPSIYSEELADKFFALVSEGVGLRQIAARDDMPAMSTLCLWLAKNDEFSERYARAKEVAAVVMSEEILEIADNIGHEDKDTIETKFGEMPNKEWVMRSKLRVDARLQLMAKIHPKKYGAKLEQKITGKVSTELSEEDQEEIIRRMAEMAPVAAAVTAPASFRGHGSEEGV